MKASAALLSLAKPSVQRTGAHSAKGFERVVTLTMIGWSLAVQPDKEAHFRSLVTSSMNEIPPGMREVIEGIIDLARDAKLEYFPDDDRVFASVHVEDRPEGPFVTVQSMDPDEQRAAHAGPGRCGPREVAGGGEGMGQPTPRRRPDPTPPLRPSSWPEGPPRGASIRCKTSGRGDVGCPSGARKKSHTVG